MKSHSFDVQDAEKYGVNKAILLNHLKFHMNSNIRDERFHKHGKVWCFAKLDSLAAMYPYMAKSSISRWLKELEDDGVIKSTKPQKNQGRHLKYYRVIGFKAISQNEKSPNKPETENKSKKDVFKESGGISHIEKSISQNETSKKSQNETSSIVTNISTIKGSIVSAINTAETKADLLIIWEAYRKEKGKHMTMYERDVLLNSTWLHEPIHIIKKTLLNTIENGWGKLVKPDDSGKEEKQFNPEIAKQFYA